MGGTAAGAGSGVVGGGAAAFVVGVSGVADGV
jgi:hypothetical protein